MQAPLVVVGDTVQPNLVVITAVAREPRSGDLDPLPTRLVRALTDAKAICVVDRGIGVGSHPQIREVLAKVSGRVPIVWSPHPLGADPIPDAALVTVNEFQTHGHSAEALRERWEARAVFVTLGARGALVATRWRGTSRVPLPAGRDVFAGGDTCGVWNQFAVAAAAEFGRGADALIASARAASVVSTAAMTRRLVRLGEVDRLARSSTVTRVTIWPRQV